MSDFTAGDVKVKIGVDAKNAIDEIEKLKKQVEDLKKELGGLKDKTEEVEEADAKVSDLQGLVMAQAAASAVKGLIEVMSSMIKKAMEFESAMAGVAKTTDMSGDELEDYGKALREMSNNMPMTTKELAGISEMAGQLGISGSKNLLKFTDTMAKLGTATNMTAEDAATMLAQFASITGMDTSDYERLASTIVGLGNNYATTESQIAQMALGMAASATNAGIAEREIMALSTAASSMGVSAQAGSTAWSKLIDEMQQAVDTGEDLDKWAEASGMTAGQFKAAWGQNATGAIHAFINGLRQHNSEGRSMSSILTDLGIKEVQQRSLIESLATSDDVLGKALATSNQAWEENNALNREAATRFQTTESKMQMLRNKADNISTTIGEQLAPAFSGVLDVVDEVVGAFGEFAEENEWIGPVLMGVAVGLGVLAVALGGATIAATSFGSTMAMVGAALLTNPVTWVIAGIAAATVAIVAITAELAKASDEMEGFSEQAEQMADASKELKKGVDEVRSSNEHGTLALKNYMDIVDELGKKTNRTQGEQWQLEYALDQLNQTCPDLALSIDDVKDGLSEEAKAALKAADAQGRYNAIMAKSEEIQGQLIDAEISLKSAEQELTRQRANLTSEQIAQAEALHDAAEGADLSTLAFGNLAFQYYALDDETRTYVNSLREYDEIQNSCTETTKNAEDAQAALDGMLEDVQAEYAATGEAAQGLTVDTTNLTDEQKKLAEAYQESGSEIIAELEQLSVEYEEARQKALDNITSQIKGWNELEANADVTVDSMIKGYRSQTDYMKTYTNNMRSLLDRNIDGLDDYVKAIDDGSADAAGAFAAMKDASDEELQELVSSFQEREGAVDNYSSSVAGMQTDYDARMDDIINSTKRMVSEFDRYDEAYTAASNTMRAVVDSADNMVNTVASKYKYLMKTAIQQLQATVTMKLSTKTGSDTARITSTFGGPHFDKGGYITKPQIALIAEKRPEFVGAAEDLQTFINQSVNQAFNLSLPTLPTIKSKGDVTVNVPISVSRELTDADIERKAKKISSIVSKSFAETTGGSL